MKRTWTSIALVAALVGVAAAVAAAAYGPTATRATITRVADGDTVSLSSGARVRLVQIDTPELGSGECYSRAAARELRRLTPPGSTVGLEADPSLDQVDHYGRLLRYLWRGRTNVNLELVRRGAATVWLYRGDHGKYAQRLLAAARSARAAKRGLWGACRTVWDPYSAATTYPKTRSGGSTSGGGSSGGCDPSYPTVCIPPPPPDLDCGDISYRNFVVRGSDPHRFDGNHDGRGCEG